MAAMLCRTLRSRLLPRLSRKPTAGPLSYSTAAPEGALKEPIVASDAILKDQQPPPPPPSPDTKKSRGFLKYGAVALIAGAVGTVSYATYAYSLDEVDLKTSSLRNSSNYMVEDDASVFEKFKALVYSSVLKVPAKSVEFYMDARRTIEEQIRGFTEPSSEKLLPDLLPPEQHVFTLVLDLNETLVYSDWKPFVEREIVIGLGSSDQRPNMFLPERERGWRTFKRHGVDAFLEHMAKYFEVVVYSDQLPMYVEPVLERLDQKGYIRYRLSRTETRYLNGKHYRDLSKLNRDPSHIIYVSGHALESSLQPENCVPIKPWKLENDDTALLDIIPFLEFVAVHRPPDIRPVLASYQGHDIATEFIERSKEHQRRMQEKKRGFWRR